MQAWQQYYLQIYSKNKIQFLFQSGFYYKKKIEMKQKHTKNIDDHFFSKIPFQCMEQMFIINDVTMKLILFICFV